MAGDICPTFFLIDGYIFLDRDKVGEKKLRLEIAESPSIKEAQYEMNIIPLSDFVEQFTTTEDPDDPGVKRIVAICEDNWTIRIKAAFPKVEFEIVHWSNDDAGEYGLRLQTIRMIVLLLPSSSILK